MNTDKAHQPQRTNTNHFSTEQFPEVIAFCDRDDNTRINNGTEEHYSYKLHGAVVFTLKKGASQWELVEYHGNAIIRVSTGKTLAMVLMQGLRFVSSDKVNQEKSLNIIFPVEKAKGEEALAFMYYYGGYPANFLPNVTELSVIVEHFISPEALFLSFSYVPAEYIEWLRNQLASTGLIEPKNLWIYKK